MPTTTVGIYEVVLEQLYFQDEFFNVFHYLSNTSDDDVQDLCATAFDEDIMATLAPTQNVDLKYTNIRCKNLTGNLADFNLTPSQGDGDIVGAVVAGFNANSFRYNRVTKETRNGAKRFAGLVEENVIGGNFTVAYNLILDSLAAVLEVEINTVGGAFTPIILRKPPIGDLFTYNNVQGVDNLDRMTTQNSRKRF